MNWASNAGVWWGCWDCSRSFKEGQPADGPLRDGSLHDGMFCGWTLERLLRVRSVVCLCRGKGGMRRRWEVALKLSVRNNYDSMEFVSKVQAWSRIASENNDGVVVGFSGVDCEYSELFLFFQKFWENRELG